MKGRYNNLGHKACRNRYCGRVKLSGGCADEALASRRQQAHVVIEEDRGQQESNAAIHFLLSSTGEEHFKRDASDDHEVAH